MLVHFNGTNDYSFTFRKKPKPFLLLNLLAKISQDAICLSVSASVYQTVQWSWNLHHLLKAGGKQPLIIETLNSSLAQASKCQAITSLWVSSAQDNDQLLIGAYTLNRLGWKIIAAITVVNNSRKLASFSQNASCYGVALRGKRSWCWQWECMIFH